MLSFAYERCDGMVPEPGEPDEDRALLDKVEAGTETVGELQLILEDTDVMVGVMRRPVPTVACPDWLGTRVDGIPGLVAMER